MGGPASPNGQQGGRKMAGNKNELAAASCALKTTLCRGLRVDAVNNLHALNMQQGKTTENAICWWVGVWIFQLPGVATYPAALRAPYAWKSRLTSQLLDEEAAKNWVKKKQAKCNEHSPSKLKYLFLASFLVSFSWLCHPPPAMHILKCIEMQIVRQVGGLAGGRGRWQVASKH